MESSKSGGRARSQAEISSRRHPTKNAHPENYIAQVRVVLPQIGNNVYYEGYLMSLA